MPDKIRCVLVDDDADFCALVHFALERSHPDYEIITFHGGLEAFGYLLRHHADLLVTDFRMPELDGLRLTTRVRSLFKNTSIIIMSGQDIEAQALAAGANAFVRKADIPEHLIAAVDALPLPVVAEPRPSRRLA